MLASIGQTHDPSARIDLEETTWRYLLEKATPEQRSGLNAMKSEERAELIRTTIQQREEAASEERDE
jgi:hypothetical protein